MSSSATDSSKKSSQIIKIAELIVRVLDSKKNKSPLTINELRKSADLPDQWSLYLSSLAYLSETEIIQIQDDGVINLKEKKGKSGEISLNVILEEIKENYDFTLTKLAE